MRGITTLLSLFLSAGLLQAGVKSETVTYTHDGTTFKGFLAYDDEVSGKRPGVLIVHEWMGLDDYAKKRAELLASMGYVAFAADMYGDGKVAEHPKDAAAMMNTVRGNVTSWQGRANASLDVLKKHNRADPKKLAAIGYCFGGATVLQLAYTGADVGAVVSFHGALPVATTEQAKAIKGKVLICHGAEDSHIKDAELQKFRMPLSDAKADYQIVIYGGATHSFTVPGVENRAPNMKYNPDADRRSWRAMQELFDEAFGK